MKKIYLLLMHTYSIPSRIVKVLTRFEYSHVALSLDKECNTLYSFGRKKLNSILNGGFSIEQKDGDFFKKFHNTKCTIYELELSDIQYYNIKNMLKDITENRDCYKYDFLGVILRYLKIHKSFKNKFVCSQFVAYILDKNDIYKFNKDISQVMPRDFLNMQGFNEIYKGKYLSYTSV